MGNARMFLVGASSRLLSCSEDGFRTIREIMSQVSCAGIANSLSQNRQYRIATSEGKLSFSP